MIQIENVSKVFGTGAVGLSDINISVEKGEFVFLVGHTGSGKTTLLRLLIRELLPTKGKISVADIDIVRLPHRKIPHLRKKIGVVFQDLKLLMDRTIFENVLLPLQITNAKVTDAKKRVEELLFQVGILEHKDKFPIQLSGGELQRAAIARALTLSPNIILADEPTGNLDNKTAIEIVELLSTINKQLGTTILMVTHNLDILKKYPKNRIVGLDSGKIIKDQKAQKDTDFSEEKHESKEKKSTEEIKDIEKKQKKDSEKIKDVKENQHK